MATRRAFDEACDGYGFEEVEQRPDGTYCTGCGIVHKRPTKMYSNGAGETMCRDAILRFYRLDD